MQAKTGGQETPKRIEGSRSTLRGSVDFMVDLRGPSQGWQKYGKTLSFHDFGMQNLIKTLRFPTFLSTVMPSSRCDIPETGATGTERVCQSISGWTEFLSYVRSGLQDNLCRGIFALDAVVQNTVKT